MLTREAAICLIACSLVAFAPVLAQERVDRSHRQFSHGTWRGRPVTYEVVDGWAIVEGDIIVGTVEPRDRAEGYGSRPVRPCIRI